MALTVSITPKSAHLFVSVDGVFNLKMSTENMDRILDACNKHNISRVIVDFRSVKGSPSIMDSYDYIVSTAKKQIENICNGGPSIRFAYVAKDSLLFHNTFSESVAANRGLDLKVTTQLDEAAKWLGIDEKNVLGAD